MRLGNINGN